MAAAAASLLPSSKRKKPVFLLPPPQSFLGYMVHLMDKEMHVKERLQIDVEGKLESNYHTQVLIQFRRLATHAPPDKKCNICGFLLLTRQDGLEYLRGHTLTRDKWLIVMSILCGKKKCRTLAEAMVESYIITFSETLTRMKLMDKDEQTSQQGITQRLIVCNHCKAVEIIDQDHIKTFQCCAGCLAVYYCHKKCQKANWQVHKPSCLAYHSHTHSTER